MLPLAILSLSLLGSAAAAATQPTNPFASLLQHLPAQPRELRARQVVDPSTPPSQCSSKCNPIVQTLSNCYTASCGCSSTDASELQDCINCIVSASTDSLASYEGQSYLDSYSDICIEGGVTVPSLTVSGGSGGLGPTPTFPPNDTSFPTSFPTPTLSSGQSLLNNPSDFSFPSNLPTDFSLSLPPGATGGGGSSNSGFGGGGGGGDNPLSGVMGGLGAGVAVGVSQLCVLTVGMLAGAVVYLGAL